MRFKKAGLIGKVLLVSTILFIFLVVSLKYPAEGKIIATKLYTLLIITLDFLIETIGWIIKQIAR